ncbi:hypothetical protein I7860_20585 [Pseudomonas tolaasii]|uniref:hypothetical protein n=1 Tax=Pseudomonas tolaasii TaxID=29442 RepID=UPI001C5A3D99|nr:hypothetical protein [Pseudomonas tolaasii]MBW1249076.1 hypothetical protein [Pseudomonas tolaasii]
MSEITRGAIGMPFEMAMESELSRRQFHSIAQALLVERDQLKAENARSTEREILQLAEIEALRQILASSHEFIMNDARTRHMCDEAGQVSQLFPKRVAILASIDTALARESSHDRT